MNLVAIAFPIVLVLSIGTSGISWADKDDDNGLTKQRDEGGSKTAGKHATGQEQRLAEPKDCKEIAAGTGGEGNTIQQAAQRDCEGSQALGSGTGVSSGTGTGKAGSAR